SALCFSSVELPRRHELSVGQMRQTFLATLDADELLDVAPPRRQILVAEWPVDAEAFACVRLEIEVAPAINAATPHDRATTDLSPANPVKGLPFRRRVRIVEIVDEELARVFIAGAGVSLNGLISLELLSIAHASIALLP